MAIEFRCPSCQQLLRVPDESGGKNARCPQCQSLVQVPSAQTPSTAGQPPSPPSWQPPQPFGQTPPAAAKPQHGPKPASEPVNPYAASDAVYTDYRPIPNPFAGGIQPQRVSIEPIWNHAWQIWQANIGLLAGTTFVALLITTPIDFGSEFVKSVLEEQGEEAAGNVIGGIGSIISSLLEVYLGIGQAIIALKLARGLPAEFSDLFSGGPRFLPVLGGSILAGIAVTLGILLCIVPGILLMLMFWPYYYLVVEEKSRVMDSFGVANKITEGNWGTAFVLALLSFVIALVGLLAFCIGIVFAIPLISLVWATAYLMMSGQLSPYPMYVPPAQQPFAAGWPPEGVGSKQF